MRFSLVQPTIVGNSDDSRAAFVTTADPSDGDPARLLRVARCWNLQLSHRGPCGFHANRQMRSANLRFVSYDLDGFSHLGGMLET